jgi:hypothetical protein
MSTFNGGALPEDVQDGAQIILGFVIDLFTIGAKSEFTREEILVILNMVKNDPELFDDDTILFHESVGADTEFPR